MIFGVRILRNFTHFGRPDRWNLPIFDGYFGCDAYGHHQASTSPSRVASVILKVATGFMAGSEAVPGASRTAPERGHGSEARPCGRASDPGPRDGDVLC